MTARQHVADELRKFCLDRQADCWCQAEAAEREGYASEYLRALARAAEWGLEAARHASARPVTPTPVDTAF